jgi:ribose transport system substrate-binding protein
MSMLNRRSALLGTAATLAMGARAATPATPPKTATSRPTRVAILMADLYNPFFSEVTRAFHDRLRQLQPGVRASMHSAGFDHERQYAQMRELLQRGVDLVLITPIDAALMAPLIAEARRSGVIVVAVDSLIDHTDLTVTTDNFAAGRIACEYLVQRLRGKGTVAIIHGPENNAAVDRVTACREVLQRNPGIRQLSTTVNGGATRVGGLERMVSLMAAHPHIDGIFAVNDPSALGAESAARQAGRKDMLMASVDGSAMAVERLHDPTSLFVATSAQDPRRMGMLAAEGAVTLLRHGKLAERLVLLQPRLITRDNVASYKTWDVPR